MKFKLGNTDIPFVFRGDEMMYPNYIKDGLVLHYDFSGMTNADASRGIAKDLSGNGNHGALQNFNFTPESGYDKNKLLFDGVDDGVETSNGILGGLGSYTITFTFKVIELTSNLVSYLMCGTNVGRVWIVSVGSNLSAQMYFGTGLGYTSHITTSIESKGVVNVSYIINRESGIQYTLLNGINVRELDISGASQVETYSGAVKLGSQSSAYSQPNAEYYDVKIYNRPLTPEEISHNYAIEKERFGIE